MKPLKIKNEHGFNLGSRQRLIFKPNNSLATDSPAKVSVPKLERGCKIVIKLPRRGQQSTEIKELLTKKLLGSRVPPAYTYY